MANPAGPGAPDPRSLGEVAQDIVVDLGKLTAGLHAAGADPNSTTMLMHMAEVMGELGKALSIGPVGSQAVDHSALGQPQGAAAAQGPQGAQAALGAAPPAAAAGPQGAPMHGSQLPQHSLATAPQPSARGGIHDATTHLRVAMQAAKAAAAAHAAMAAQTAGQEEPAPGAGGK